MKQFLALALLASCLLWAGQAGAQSAKGVSIPLRFEYPATGHGIILRWDKDAGFVSATARRRQPEVDFTFYEFDPASGNTRRIVTFLSDSSAIDTSYRPGMLAEYEIKMVSTTTANVQYDRVGVLPVCQDCQPDGARGKILLILEKTIADSLPAEVAELRQDLRADGWLVRTVEVLRTQSVTAVKDSITRIRATDGRVKMVYLLGQVPVPYSGNVIPDGHTEHRGAWPADGYYSSTRTTFTDATINSATAARVQNRNVPGDGKFDASSFTDRQPVMGIARVSMHDLPVFGQTEVTLTRRYLQKAHLYKTGGYVPNATGLIDDNFGYFGGEAFAAAGWISMNACIGQDKVSERPRDLLVDSRTTRWLMGYGCGGGGYTSCADVATSSAFATQSVNVVFVQMFGSYFGDWDSQNNLMRSAIASQGGVLTCSWSGRPWHYYHLMGIGKPYGETARINMYNSTTMLPQNYGPRIVSNGFMGDPSLRLLYFRPPTLATARQASGQTVQLTWTPSPDTLAGYHVYRATSDTAAFVRLTQAPVQDSVYVDAVAAGSRYYYMVRGVRTQAYPGGTYQNQSLGAHTGPVAILTAAQPTLRAVLNIYPNPTQGMVRVESDQSIQAIEVLDGLGRMVLERDPNSTKTQVDMAAWPKGVYTLRVQTGGAWQVRRVVRW